MVTEWRHVGVAVSDLDRYIRVFTEYLGIKSYKEFTNLNYSYLNRLVGGHSNNIRICVFDLPGGAKIELLQYDFTKKVDTTPFFIGSAHIALTVNDLEDLYSRRDIYDVNFVHAPMYNPERSVKLSFANIGNELNLELVELLPD